MAIIKDKKKAKHEQIEPQSVQSMSVLDIDGINFPAPDVISSVQNQDNNAIPNIQFGDVPLNEQALEELCEKEEENLKKKENSQNKSLEEIKNNLNSLDSFFKNINNSLYDEEFYSNLKMQISK